MGNANSGFASLDLERRRQLASAGGKAAHANGRAHEFTPEEARIAGRKGGLKLAENLEYMAAIGRRGGKSLSMDRAHMSEIGRKGGLARRQAAAALTAVEVEP